MSQHPTEKTTHALEYAVVVSQGRVADRSAGAIRGAALTAGVVERLTGAVPKAVGVPAPPAPDDWSVSLPQARATLDALRAAVEVALQHGQVPVLVANTCSASLASLPVLARERPDTVVLWVDAHGDFNTPNTTTSGYLGGMVLSAACGLWDSGHGAGLRPERVIILGGRDIDAEEADLLAKAGVRVYRPEDVKPASVLAAVGGARVWLHVDWDALEPGSVPAAYAVPGGLTPDQLRDVLAVLPHERVLGIELAEFEAFGDAEVDEAALAKLAWMIEPLFAGERRN